MEEDPPDMHQVSRKEQKSGRNYLVAGFPPLSVADFWAGDFGWEVER